MFFLHLPYKTSTNVIMYLFKLYILYSLKQMQFWRAKSNGTSAEIKFSLKKKKFYLKIQCFTFYCYVLFPLYTLLEVMGIKATELQYTQILTSFSSYNRYIVPHICFSVEWCCQSYFSIFCINVELSLKVSMTINGKPAKQTSL